MMRLLFFIFILLIFVSCNNPIQFTVGDDFSFGSSEDEPDRVFIGDKNWKHLIRFKQDVERSTVRALPVVQPPMDILALPVSAPAPHRPVAVPVLEPVPLYQQEPPPTPVIRSIQIFKPKEKLTVEAVEEHTVESPIIAQPVSPPPPTPLPLPHLLDILFVVDTSSSMDDNLISFKKKFHGFLSPLRSFNWRWGLTNADDGDAFILFSLGALRGKLMSLEKNGIELDRLYLDSKVPDYDQIFIDTVSKHGEFEYYNEWSEALEDEFVDQCDLPPYCQGYQEQPLKALKSALSKNSDFFRAKADLAVVMITNSAERANDPEHAVQPEAVIETFRHVHGSSKKLKVFAIIIPEEDENCVKENKDSQWFFPEGSHSQRAADLAYKTGGAVFSICASHYEGVSHSIYSAFQ